MSNLKKRFQEESIANITRSGKHYKPSFLRKTISIGTWEKERNLLALMGKEEDRVLAQMKRNQAYVSVWELLMVSRKYQALVLEAFPRKEYP